MSVVERTCEKCGRGFSTKTRAKWCDKCCTNTCVVCGKRRRVKPRQIATAKYCSRACRAQGDMRHVWTDEDMAYIKRHYPHDVSMPELAAKFGTSISAINRIVRKLGCDRAPIELRTARSSESRRKWTREVLIETLRILGEKEPINSAHIQKRHGSMHTAACKLFGSYGALLEAVGINYADVNLYSSRVT